MARKLDPKIAEILKDHGFGADACWDCHGTWVIYHRVLEQIAAKAGIKLDLPMVLEANSTNGVAAVCVTGTLGETSVWSIGEASPKNNKNAYCWAMAEKRAIDRVVLKLIGLHGLAYSEEEADSFKAQPQPKLEPRDIAHGVGTQPAGMGQLDVFDPWGEKEAEFIEPKEYLAYLSEKIESVGAYFPPNQHTLEWLGGRIEDSKIKLETRNVWKLGRDAWAQSPDNPANKKVPTPKPGSEYDPAQQGPLDDKPGKVMP